MRLRAVDKVNPARRARSFSRPAFDTAVAAARRWLSLLLKLA